MNKTVAIVQARMGSNRFPGKMLARLGEYTVLEWVLLRLKKAKSIDEIVLATSKNMRDDPLVGVANPLGIRVFRGDELDVLDRFYNAALFATANVIIRVCADNPFIDATEVDRLVRFYEDSDCDYACNHQSRLNSGYADGFGAEIFGFDLLSDLKKRAIHTAHREHVTSYIWDHFDDYRIGTPSVPHELACPHYRFDIDTPQDLERLRQVLKMGVELDSTAAQIVSEYRRFGE